MKPPSLQTAHESIAAAAELECVQPGTFVYVHGLKSRPELNGAIGRVSGALQENGRIPVRLDPPHEKVVALKPANLEKYLDMSTQRDSHPETVFRHVDSRGNVSKVVSSYQGNTPLRFNVGDLVECCVDKGWVSGEIVQLRYTEPSFPHAMPYQHSWVEEEAEGGSPTKLDTLFADLLALERCTDADYDRATDAIASGAKTEAELMS
eukprot:jgi/Chrpa1/112/Chrysochromulina_OHIO_Genome00008193-RA